MSPRETIAILYGWTLILAGLALALRFIPYSDDRGNFDPGWTVLMAACLIFAAAASVYVIYKLEILKLKNLRLRQRLGIAPAKGPPPDEEEIEEEVEEGVRRELETGEFAVVDPETGETAAVDPDTGEMEAVPGPAEAQPAPRRKT